MPFKLGLNQPLIRYDGGTRWAVRDDSETVVEFPNEEQARMAYTTLLDRFTARGGLHRPELVMAHISWQVVN